MKTISQAQLIVLLSNVKNAQPIGFSALTEVKAKAALGKRLLKLSTVNAFTGADYESSVNRQASREGKEESFVASARSWGKRVSPALVAKQEESGAQKFYLVAQIRSARKPIYLVQNKEGTSPLQITAKEQIKDFLPTVRPALNQGLDKEVIYRNYKIESIKQICFGGERYRVRETA